MSVQVHAELVQVLAGNAVVAKTPSQGGFHCLTLAHALMARAGLPVTLLSGIGGKLGDVLISNPGIGALAFVGGRSNGRVAATSLADRRRRHFLEQEGLNAWGIWTSPSGSCSPSICAGVRIRQAAVHCVPEVCRPTTLVARVPRYFCRSSKACASATRWLSSVRRIPPGVGLRAGDRGPGRPRNWESSSRRQWAGAFLHRGSVGAGRFLDGQDTSAYVAPACVLEPPAHWSLHHAEPSAPSTPSSVWTPRPSCSRP